MRAQAFCLEYNRSRRNPKSKIPNPKQIQIIKYKIQNSFEFRYLDFDIVWDLDICNLNLIL